MKSYNNKMRHTAALLGWFSIMVFLLIPYFHTYRLCILMIAAMYLLYTEIIKLPKINEYWLTESLNRFIGVTSLTILGWKMVSFWPLGIFKWKWESYQYVFTQFFKSFIEIFSKGNRILILILIVLFVISIVKMNPEKFASLDLFYRYMMYGTIFFLILYSYTKNAVTGRFYLAVSIIFFLGDLLKWKNHPSIKIKISPWYLWCSVIFVLTLLMENSFVIEITTKGFLEYFIFIKFLCVKNIIFISIVLAVVAFVCKHFKDENTLFIQDEFLIMMIESSLLICFVLYKCYVGYWWLFLGVYLLILIGHVLQTKVRFKSENNEYIFFALSVLGVVFWIYESHMGKAVFATALILSIIGGILFLVKKKSSRKRQKFIYSIGKTVIIGLTIITASRIYETRNLISNYLVLIGAAIFLFVLIGLMEDNQGVFVRLRANEIVQNGIIGILFLILCIGLSFKGGTNIKVKEKENKITVSTDARGKKNQIKSVKGYWMDDFAEAIIVNGEKKLPKNNVIEKLSPKESLSIEKSGRLKVVAKDKYGIKTTAMRWYRICEYKTK